MTEDHKNLIARLLRNTPNTLKDRDAAKAIEHLNSELSHARMHVARLIEEKDAVAAKLEALQVQKPIRWMLTERVYHEYEGSDQRDTEGFLTDRYSSVAHEGYMPLYTGPVAQPRDLSDDEISKIYAEIGREDGCPREFASAIIAAINKGVQP